MDIYTNKSYLHNPVGDDIHTGYDALKKKKKEGKRTFILAWQHDVISQRRAAASDGVRLKKG